MKNFFCLLAIVLWSAIPMTAHAFGSANDVTIHPPQEEEVSQPSLTGVSDKVIRQAVTDQGLTKAQVKTIVKDENQKLLNEIKTANTTAQVETQAVKQTVTSLNSVFKELAGYVKTVAKNSTAANQKIDALKTDVSAGFNAVHWALALLAIAVLFAFWGFSKRTKKQIIAETKPLNTWREKHENIGERVNAIATDVSKLNDKVETGFNLLSQQLNKLPGDVRKELEIIDPSPFVFEFDSKKVTYQSPLEVIEKGFYLELHVPKDADGDVTTYERNPQKSRYLAEKNCKKTLRRWVDGEFSGPECRLQRELLEFLFKSDKSITIKLV